MSQVPRKHRSEPKRQTRIYALSIDYKSIENNIGWHNYDFPKGYLDRKSPQEVLSISCTLCQHIVTWSKSRSTEQNRSFLDLQFPYPLQSRIEERIECSFRIMQLFMLGINITTSKYKIKKNS